MHTKHAADTSLTMMMYEYRTMCGRMCMCSIRDFCVRLNI